MIKTQNIFYYFRAQNKNQSLLDQKMGKTKFRFRGADGTRFQCDLQCRFCTERTKGGRGPTCRRRTCLSLPWCWMHAARNHGLRIKESQAVPGTKGLFATQRFAANTNMAQYLGERLTQAQLDRRYGDYTAPYALQHGREGWILDAACRRSMASMANSARGTRRRNNARFSVRRDGTVWIRSTEVIRPGTEILLRYGRDYWQGPQDSEHHTST